METSRGPPDSSRSLTVRHRPLFTRFFGTSFGRTRSARPDSHSSPTRLCRTPALSQTNSGLLSFSLLPLFLSRAVSHCFNLEARSIFAVKRHFDGPATAILPITSVSPPRRIAQTPGRRSPPTFPPRERPNFFLPIVSVSRSILPKRSIISAFVSWVPANNGI